MVKRAQFEISNGANVCFRVFSRRPLFFRKKDSAIFVLFCLFSGTAKIFPRVKKVGKDFFVEVRRNYFWPIHVLKAIALGPLRKRKLCSCCLFYLENFTVQLPFLLIVGVWGLG